VFEEISESLIERTFLRLSTGELILEATRRVQDPALVRRVIGDPSRVLDALQRSPAADAADHPHADRRLRAVEGRPERSARASLSLIPLSARTSSEPFGCSVPAWSATSTTGR